MPQNNSKEEVEVVVPRSSQLLPSIDTIHQDPKRSNKYGNTYPHRPFVGIGLDVVEVRSGRKDLIPKRHRRQHLIDAAVETKI